jgi:Tfp pilus assembly protein PilN
MEASEATEGEPIALLDRWAKAHARPGVPIRLYDARPRYYGFTMSLPMAALGRMAGAVTLKVRQELGVDDGQMTWAARVERPAVPAGRPGQVDLFVVVARRAEIEDVRLWSERAGLAGRLWVGADVDAVRCLTREGGVRAPAVLIVADGPGSATLYHADPSGAVAKGRLAAGVAGGGLPPRALEAGASDGLSRVAFGPVDAAWLAQASPALAGLTERPIPAPGQWIGEALGPSLRAATPDALLARDPVLLGALRDLTARRVAPGRLRLASGGGVTAISSLLESSAAAENVLGASLLDELIRRLPTTCQLARLTGVAGGVLALGLLACWGVRRSAQASLSAATAKIATPMEVLRSQNAVLQRVGLERKALLPVIQAIHEVAPNGMTLDSLTIAPGGQLRLACSANSRDDADAFTRRLAKSPLLAGVEAPEIKSSQGKIAFTLTARILDRQRQLAR